MTYGLMLISVTHSEHKDSLNVKLLTVKRYIVEFIIIMYSFESLMLT